jgi:hypothetical protein
MDITGGTTYSGGLSPNGRRTAAYDPSHHRWKKPPVPASTSVYLASHLTQAHARTFSANGDRPNQRYSNILGELLREPGPMLVKLHTWIEKISEDNKKGLRVIHKILEVDGKKRFKPDGTVKDGRTDLLMKDVNSVPIEDAQREFRKLTNVSQYATFFGSRPKMSHDYEILKYKKFSQLRIASILKPHVIQTIERWLAINDQEEFTKRIYYTVRDVFTIVRNQEPPVSLHKHEFDGTQVDEHAKPPRFDQLIVKHKGKRPVFDRRNLSGL